MEAWLHTTVYVVTQKTMCVVWITPNILFSCPCMGVCVIAFGLKHFHTALWAFRWGTWISDDIIDERANLLKQLSYVC